MAVAVTVPTVALTFDDGPSVWTGPLLDVLAAYDAHATFFVLGCHVEGNEEVLQRALLEGHEVGVHGWDHTPIPNLAAGELAWQLETCAIKLSNLGAPWPRYWRAPWQQADETALAVAAEYGLQHVAVDLDGRDVSRDEDAIVASLEPLLADGLIVGLHDGVAPNGEQRRTTREHTVAAVARLLACCGSVTVSELAERRLAA